MLDAFLFVLPVTCPHTLKRSLRRSLCTRNRRTSSVPPEDDAQEETEEDAHSARIAAEMEAFANEEEADPENSAWDDLDADDSEDTAHGQRIRPGYFQVSETSRGKFRLFTFAATANTHSAHGDDAQPKLYGEPKGARMENAWSLDGLVDPSPRQISSLARNTLSLCQHY